MDQKNTEIMERVLRQERQRNVAFLNQARFAAVSVFLLARLGLDTADPSSGDHAFPWILLAYWLASGLLFVSARYSNRLARLSALAIPLLDMPAVYLSQRLDLGYSTSARSVANFTLSLFVLQIMLAAFVLQAWRVVLAGIVAVGLQLGLQIEAGDTPIGMVGGGLVLAVAVAICCFTLRRRVALAEALAREEMRRERLGRYFSPQVAVQIQQTEAGLDTGQLREVTLLFADLWHFTSLSESVPPARTLELLNEFHGRMVAAVFAHGGTLDKFLGDGLMAYFGAPVTDAEHASKALLCAQAMQTALAQLNATRAVAGEAPLRMGIGLHTGTVIVGAIGTDTRREFTAVGDAVNVAARIEALTRQYKTDILVSEQTALRVGEQVALRLVDETPVRGTKRPIKLFAPAPT